MWNTHVGLSDRKRKVEARLPGQPDDDAEPDRCDDDDGDSDDGAGDFDEEDLQDSAVEDEGDETVPGLCERLFKAECPLTVIQKAGISFDGARDSGIELSVFHAAGITLGLGQTGYSLQECLGAGYFARELSIASAEHPDGFSLFEFRHVGASPRELYADGDGLLKQIDIKEREAWPCMSELNGEPYLYSAVEMHELGFSLEELAGSGCFPPEQLLESELFDGTKCLKLLLKTKTGVTV